MTPAPAVVPHPGRTPAAPVASGMRWSYLTRKTRFSAAHRYHRPEWDDARNREVFGRCGNPHGHGHNYVLEVTIAAPIDPLTGFSIDLGALDALLDREVTQPLDHQHLNHAIDAFTEGQLVPTSENLTAYLWPRLVAGLPAGVRLVRLRLHEDETFFVDYFGGGDGPDSPGTPDSHAASRVSRDAGGG